MFYLIQHTLGFLLLELGEDEKRNHEKSVVYAKETGGSLLDGNKTQPSSSLILPVIHTIMYK